MKLTVKSTKELLQVLDETKEEFFKDRKCIYPYTEWEHKRGQVIERLYGDPEVKLALHNLFVLLLKEEGASGDYAGDGTGYSVSVENHYRTNPNKYGKKFVHFFSLIDLATGMYV